MWGRLLVGMAALAAMPVVAQTPLPANDGTDPARPAKSAALSFERLDLVGGGARRSLFAEFNLPIGNGTTAIGVRAPLVADDSAGSKAFGAGDIALQLIKVLPTDSNGAIILGGEMVFDTASRPELGEGRNVLTGSVTIERKLASGAIFAPTIAHGVGLWGRSDKSINFTRLNLYFVAHIDNEKIYATIDPAMTIDWADDSQYADIALTLGYNVGRVIGADAQVFIRPSAGVGGARSFDWGVELGLQLLNF